MPSSVGNDLLTLFESRNSRVTSPADEHVTPYHDVVQGSPFPAGSPIQFVSTVHPSLLPPVPSYSATSADTAGQGVGPTKLPSATDQYVGSAEGYVDGSREVERAESSVGMSLQRSLEAR